MSPLHCPLPYHSPWTVGGAVSVLQPGLAQIVCLYVCRVSSDIVHEKSECGRDNSQLWPTFSRHHIISQAWLSLLSFVALVVHQASKYIVYHLPLQIIATVIITSVYNGPPWYLLRNSVLLPLVFFCDEVISDLQREAASVRVMKESTFSNPTCADVLTITFGHVQSMHLVFFFSIHSQAATELVTVVHMDGIWRSLPSI